jgi:GNAT superfamily N-acetyltransferase
MNVTIMRASKQFEDWTGLLTLLQQAFAYQTGRIDPPSSLNKLDAPGLASKAQEENLFLALEGDQVIGCLFARCKPEAVYVGKFAVSPGRQKQGVGRGLMEAAEDLARRVGRNVLEVETRIELVENHETFTALGFTKVAEHSHPGYDRPTYVLMRKTLPPVSAPGA